MCFLCGWHRTVYNLVPHLRSTSHTPSISWCARVTEYHMPLVSQTNWKFNSQKKQIPRAFVMEFYSFSLLLLFSWHVFEWKILCENWFVRVNWTQWHDCRFYVWICVCFILKDSNFHDWLWYRLFWRVHVITGQRKLVENVIDGAMVAENVVVFGIWYFEAIDRLIGLLLLVGPKLASRKWSKVHGSVAITFRLCRSRIVETRAEVKSFQCWHTHTMHAAHLNTRCGEVVVILKILDHFPAIRRANVPISKLKNRTETSN